VVAQAPVTPLEQGEVVGRLNVVGPGSQCLAPRLLSAMSLAERCELQISYAIGVAEPTSIGVDTFSTGKVDDDRIIALIQEHFDLRPKGLIAMLDLLRPIYLPTAAYGHFGRDDLDLSWERTDRAGALKADAGL